MLSERQKNFTKTIVLLRELISAELKHRYTGTLLGRFWLFGQPLVTVALLWFVFSIGLKPPSIHGDSLLAWLVAGMIPWFMLSDGLMQGASSFVEKPYLIKKMVFNFSLLVWVKSIASISTQIVFVPIMLIVMLASGSELSIHVIQLPLVILLGLFLIYSVSLLTGSLSVFSKDVTNILGVFLQLGFWATPIIWTPGEKTTAIPSWVFNLNPGKFLVDSFRASTVGHQWIFSEPGPIIVFIASTVLIYALGLFVFRALRDEFADAL